MRCGCPGLPLPALGWLMVLLSAAALFIWHPGERTQIGRIIEGRLLDLRFQLQGPRPPPDAVAIVIFDDLAVTPLSAFPPSRSDIAEAVRRIFAAGAEVVAIDLLLVDPRGDDPSLAAALKRGEAVLGVGEAPAGADPTPLLARAVSGWSLVAIRWSHCRRWDQTLVCKVTRPWVALQFYRAQTVHCAACALQ